MRAPLRSSLVLAALRCWLDGIGEFAPRITLEFADGPVRGLTLRAVIAST